MWIKVTVTGSDGRSIEHAADVHEEGELPRTVGEATEIYRKFYPDAPAFDYTFKVSHA
jgi:hypothetical protein